MTKDYNLIALSPHPLVVDETPVMYRAGQIRSLFSAIADRDAQIERMRSELDEIATPAPPPEPAKAEVAQRARDLLCGLNQWPEDKHPTFSNGDWREIKAVIAEAAALATPPTAPAAARSAAEEMRERCAVAAGQRGSTDSPSVWSRGYAAGRLDAAADIRALPGEEA